MRHPIAHRIAIGRAGPHRTSRAPIVGGPVDDHVRTPHASAVIAPSSSRSRSAQVKAWMKAPPAPAAAPTRHLALVAILVAEPLCSVQPSPRANSGPPGAPVLRAERKSLLSDNTSMTHEFYHPINTCDSSAAQDRPHWLCSHCASSDARETLARAATAPARACPASTAAQDYAARAADTARPSEHTMKRK